MPLYWNTKDVKIDTNDDAIWPVTNALIWGTMSIGMNSISEVDWKEFYTRCHIIEAIHGNWLVKDGKPRLITPQDVYDHIGLSTNASNMTNAKFKASIDERFRQQAKDMIELYQPVEIA